MILTLRAYVLLAVLPATVWVWARLWYARNMRQQRVVQSTAKVIRFPRERTKPQRAPGL
jgi:hypothetical protein